MKLSALKKEFIELLYNACLADVSYLKENFSGNTFFSYAIYCDNGFVSFGSAACSREWLQQQLIKLQQFHDNNRQRTMLYAETFAAEWGYYGNYQTFQHINKFVDDIFQTFYDDAFEDLNTSPASLDFAGLNAFFQRNIIDVIRLLKISSCFESSIFQPDLLSRLQYGDADKNERKFIVEISEAVNSSVWHEKIVEAYKKWL